MSSLSVASKFWFVFFVVSHSIPVMKFPEVVEFIIGTLFIL